MIPTRDIDGCKATHARILATLTDLEDEVARRPSRLPGWTVGHIVTHMARNADSHVPMLRAAERGEVLPQYPGGPEQRLADIEAGAHRPAAELVADLAEACRRLEATWDEVASETWAHGRGRIATGEIPVSDLVFRRWREAEVHHADLGLGFGFEDWSDAYVGAELQIAVAGLAARLSAGEALRLEAIDTGAAWAVPDDAPARGSGWPRDERVLVAAPSRHLLAWLLGRLERPDFPAIAPWERRPPLP